MPDPAPHASLRFTNTALGRGDDPIATPAALLRWLGDAVEGPDVTPPEARRLHDEAMRLREAFASALRAVRDRRSIPDPALSVIERSLAAGRWRRTIASPGPELRLELVPLPGRDPLARRAPLAADLIDVLAAADPGRLRTCADAACGRWFLDTSRGGQRRWCSMATCGNRAKAERWRARRRDD